MLVFVASSSAVVDLTASLTFKYHTTTSKKELSQPITSVHKPSTLIAPPVPVVPLQWQTLPSLPPWINVAKPEAKNLKDEEALTKPIEIVVTKDVTIQWTPFPPFCKKCLIRRRPTRAADHPTKENTTSVGKQNTTKISTLTGVSRINANASGSDDGKLQDGAGNEYVQTTIADRHLPRIHGECMEDIKSQKLGNNKKAVSRKELSVANQKPTKNADLPISVKTDVNASKEKANTSSAQLDSSQHRSKPTSTISAKLSRKTTTAKTQLQKFSSSTDLALKGSDSGSRSSGQADMTTGLKPIKRIEKTFKPVVKTGGNWDVKKKNVVSHLGVDSSTKSSSLHGETSGVNKSMGSSKIRNEERVGGSTRIHHPPSSHDRQKAFTSSEYSAVPIASNHRKGFYPAEGHGSLASVSADVKTQPRNSKQQNVTSSACNTATTAMHHGKNTKASGSLTTIATDALGGLSEEELIILLSSDEEEDVNEISDVRVTKSVPTKSSWKPSGGGRQSGKDTKSSQSAKGTKSNRANPANSTKPNKTGSGKPATKPPNMRTLFHYAKTSASPSAVSTSNSTPSSAGGRTQLHGGYNRGNAAADPSSKPGMSSSGRYVPPPSNKMGAGQSSSTTTLKSAEKSSEEENVLHNCPMCQLTFKAGWSQLQIDGHIAACLAESNEDVFW